METLKVIIQRNRGNYGATIDDERIGGAVVATHESYEGVWEAIRSALEFSCRELHQRWRRTARMVGKWRLRTQK